VAVDKAHQPMNTGGMNDEQLPDEISSEDWSASPVSVRELILSLQGTVKQLSQRISELKEQINRNSRNSSKPPSSDPPNRPAPPKRASIGLKAGGQT